MNSDHALAVKCSSGLCGFLLSRIAAPPVGRDAISTHADPLGQKLALCQRSGAWVREFIETIILFCSSDIRCR